MAEKKEPVLKVDLRFSTSLNVGKINDTDIRSLSEIQSKTEDGIIKGLKVIGEKMSPQLTAEKAYLEKYYEQHSSQGIAVVESMLNDIYTTGFFSTKFKKTDAGRFGKFFEKNIFKTSALSSPRGDWQGVTWLNPPNTSAPSLTQLPGQEGFDIELKAYSGNSITFSTASSWVKPDGEEGWAASTAAELLTEVKNYLTETTNGSSKATAYKDKAWRVVYNKIANLLTVRVATDTYKTGTKEASLLASARDVGKFAYLHAGSIGTAFAEKGEGQYSLFGESAQSLLKKTFINDYGINTYLERWMLKSQDQEYDSYMTDNRLIIDPKDREKTYSLFDILVSEQKYGLLDMANIDEKVFSEISKKTITKNADQKTRTLLMRNTIIAAIVSVQGGEEVNQEISDTITSFCDDFSGLLNARLQQKDEQSRMTVGIESLYEGVVAEEDRGVYKKYLEEQSKSDEPIDFPDILDFAKYDALQTMMKSAETAQYSKIFKEALPSQNFTPTGKNGKYTEFQLFSLLCGADIKRGEVEIFAFVDAKLYTKLTETAFKNAIVKNIVKFKISKFKPKQVKDGDGNEKTIALSADTSWSINFTNLMDLYDEVYKIKNIKYLHDLVINGAENASLNELLKGASRTSLSGEIGFNAKTGKADRTNRIITDISNLP